MRLCLIINSLEAGGAEKVLSDLANYWANTHEVHIITFRGEKDKPFYPLHPKVTLHPIGENYRLSTVEKITKLIPSALKLRKKVASLNPDRVISFVDLMNIFSLISLKGLKFPHIISERVHPAYHPLSAFAKILRKLTYPWAACLVIQTQAIADYFSARIYKKLIPNGINKPSRIANKVDASKIIMSVGRLAPQKGFDLLIKAFADLTNDFPDWALHIYGEGASRPSLENLIANYGLERKILLKGVKANVADLLAEAALFVFPSRYEGFPNALGEAMALGLPALASDIPGNRELIIPSQNGLLFDTENETQLKESLRALLSNPQLRLQLGKEAQKVSQAYAPQNIYKLWDDLINEARIK